MGLSELDGFLTGIVVGPELTSRANGCRQSGVGRSRSSGLKRRCMRFLARSWAATTRSSLASLTIQMTWTRYSGRGRGRGHRIGLGGGFSGCCRAACKGLGGADQRPSGRHHDASHSFCSMAMPNSVSGPTSRWIGSSLWRRCRTSSRRVWLASRSSGRTASMSIAAHRQADGQGAASGADDTLCPGTVDGRFSDSSDDPTLRR